MHFAVGTSYQTVLRHISDAVILPQTVRTLLICRLVLYKCQSRAEKIITYCVIARQVQ